MAERHGDLVRIAAYIFIDTFSRRIGKSVPGPLFNRYMVLLSRKPAARGTGMRLPHCWYRWGDEALRDAMPYLRWKCGDFRSASVEFIGGVPRIVSDSLAVPAHIPHSANPFIQPPDSPLPLFWSR